MGLRAFKPTSPGRRTMSVITGDGVTSGARPPKSLLAPARKTGGRNSHGWLTIRHIGGGHKQRYRILDFKRDKDGVTARVASIQYDPNRSARIALLNYQDGDRRFILAPDGLKVGQTLVGGKGSDIVVGNCMPLSEMPLGT